MNSVRDTALKRWVAPFGNSGINDRSHLPRTYRSVPRPSSPLDAKAFTRCPSLPHHHPTPATGPDAFPGGLSAFGLLEPGLHRTRPCLRPVPPRNIQTLRRMQSPAGAMERAPAGITTNVEHPVRPNPDNRPATWSENQNSCPTARRSHSQGKHHTMTNSIPTGQRPPKTIVAGTGAKPAPGPWSTSSQNISWTPTHPQGGGGGPGPIRTADLTLIRGAL